MNTIMNERIGSGVGNDFIRARVFGELIKLAAPIVKDNMADLYHDAWWLGRQLTLSVEAPEFRFLFAARESGTHIGTGERHFASLDKIVGAVTMWRIGVRVFDTGAVWLRIDEVDTDN